MTVEIRILTLGIAATNAYLVANTNTNEAVLIDPVDEPELIVQTATDEGWTIKLMIATHAHFDHVLASFGVKEMTGAPFYIHADAAATLPSVPDRGMSFVGHSFPDAATPDRFLTSESETITAAGLTFQTLYTPGHAAGHLSLYMPDLNLVFSGDALFAGSIGRTDPPRRQLELLLTSIREQLLPLGDDVRVLPGHGATTTIGQERLTNPFLIH